MHGKGTSIPRAHPDAMQGMLSDARPADRTEVLVQFAGPFTSPR
jgi:hypothetical protein